MPQSDFTYPESTSGHHVPVPSLGTSFPIDYDASVASSILSTYTEAKSVLLRITPTSDCFITSAVTPTALADGTHHYLPAGIPQDLCFPTSHKIALIKLTAAGSAYCTVMR
jgi:hypothetical protein